MSVSLYDQIVARDAKVEGCTGWIQWKGTSVCMDIVCLCGVHLHADEEFFYGFKCGACGRHYAVGANIQMIELTPEEIEYRRNFVTLEPDAPTEEG